MKLIGVVRLGRDAELRYAPSGDAVCSFSGAYNYGKRGQDGKRPSQWVEFSLWGKRAESLAPYLTKGAQVFVSASDACIETFERREGGQGVKLKARVDDVQLLGGRESEDKPAPNRTAPAAPKPATSFDDMDNDIPF